jgi:hypothetical protein
MANPSATVTEPVGARNPGAWPPSSRPCGGAPRHRPGCIYLWDIRRRAYELWEAAGKPEGDGARFWLAAEQELHQADREFGAAPKAEA